MRSRTSVPVRAAVMLAVAAGAAPPAGAQSSTHPKVEAGGGASTVWQQSPDIQDDWGPSQKSLGTVSLDAEVADDFNLVGTISTINVVGYNSSFNGAGFNGLMVRLYEFGADNKPGALQQEYFLAPDSPDLTYNPQNLSNFGATLSPPFTAAGSHFVSVQLLLDFGPGGKWFWRSSNTDNPSGEALYMRAPGIGVTDWSHGMYIDNFGKPLLLDTANSDAAFTLIGIAAPSRPVITNLSNSQIALADRLVINGDSFGSQSGAVSIGSVEAAVSEWSNLQITAYPRDATPLGPTTLTVTNAGGSSNTPISVIARQDPDGPGPANWRFKADGLYIDSRAAVGGDGTIYFNDVNGHLYALEPDGGVKWIITLSPPLAYQPPDVGPDGTIYVAAYLTIYALNPDGTVIWQFTDSSGAERPIFAGPSIGPDGNIYAADADFNDGTGLGAFSLTPAGVLRWNTPGFYQVASGGSVRGQEIVFDSHGQLYFTNSSMGPGGGSFYAFTLDGALVFPEDASKQQLGVSPDGNVIYGALFDPFSPASLVALDSSGNHIFSVFGNGQPSVTAGIDVGNDGNLYTGVALSTVVSVNPQGAVRWTHPIPGNPIRYDPIVSPDDSVVAVASYTPFEHGEVRGLSALGGTENWLVTLPFENDGFVWPMYRARPRFSADSQTVYLGTTHNNTLTDPYCYLYAIEATSAAACDGDIDGSNDVGFGDLTLLLVNWGPCPGSGPCPWDLDRSGDIGFGDLTALLLLWGPC